MARRSRVMKQEDNLELDMTPMLDVVFILLIFFIVTSVFVKTPGVDVFRPQAQITEKWSPTIIVAVTSDNEVWIDKSPYTLNEIRPVILAMRDENPKGTGMIQADGGADVGTVMEVNQLMTDLGIDTRVSTD